MKTHCALMKTAPKAPNEDALRANEDALRANEDGAGRLVKTAASRLMTRSRSWRIAWYNPIPSLAKRLHLCLLF